MIDGQLKVRAMNKNAAERNSEKIKDSQVTESKTPREFTNLHGQRVILNERYSAKNIECYLCGKKSENVSDFSFCGPKGFAHPDCLEK
jgi:hypothetical protein